MITLSLGDILNDRVDLDSREELFQLYVIREGDTVFYVGMTTRTVLERIWEHCGLSAIGGCDEIGRFVMDHLPESGAWHVDLMEVQEVDPALGDRRGAYHIRKAEQKLIARLRPCLNHTGNGHPAPLPEHYKRQAIADRLSDESAQP